MLYILSKPPHSFVGRLLLIKPERSSLVICSRCVLSAPPMKVRNNSIPVEKITTFDIVKTIQRSTVKAIALHGLGLNLWIGEDTRISKATPPAKKEKAMVKKGDKVWTGKIVPWIERMKGQKTTDEIISVLSNGYVITPTLKKHIENECTK